jgi:hypothetical protein
MIRLQRLRVRGLPCEIVGLIHIVVFSSACRDFDTVRQGDPSIIDVHRLYETTVA